MVDAKTEDWIEIAQRGFENWKAKPHNARWFRKIDGTPIPNDLTICIGEAFAEPLRSLSLRVEAEKRAREEATEDTRSLCRFILSEWGPDGALKATTYSLEQREARSAKGGDANDSGPSRPIDATSPGVTAGASAGEDAELCKRVDDTLQAMASQAFVPMGLWDKHSNGVLALIARIRSLSSRVEGAERLAYTGAISLASIDEGATRPETWKERAENRQAVFLLAKRRAEAAETHSAALARALEDVSAKVDAFWNDPERPSVHRMRSKSVHELSDAQRRARSLLAPKEDTDAE